MSYNGWTNRETWQVNLWLGDIFADTRSEHETLESFEEDIEAIVREEVGYQHPSLLGDIVNDWIGEVDFKELAETYFNES